MMIREAPSLLITDDDRDFRETLREVFRPRGFRTLLARDGEEALRIIRREPVHLLLMDVHMPRLTGLETIRLLRQHDTWIPCILLSAALDDTIARQAREADVFSVLRKPVSCAEITGIVRRALQLTYGWSCG